MRAGKDYSAKKAKMELEVEMKKGRIKVKGKVKTIKRINIFY